MLARLTTLHAPHNSYRLKWDGYCVRGLVPPDCHFEQSNHSVSYLSGY